MLGKKAFKVLTSAVVVAAMLIPGMSSAAATTYEPVAGGSCTFKKTLLFDEDAAFPDAGITFEFEIDGGDAIIDASANQVAVYSGTDENRVEGTAIVEPVTFDADDTYDDIIGGVTQDVIVNLSAVTYNEPGVYRYKITEVKVQSTSIAYDTNEVRYLDVYVEDAVENDTHVLKVVGYVLHNQEDYVPGTTGPTDKSVGFTNNYNTADLTIALEVAGNQASRDEYFKVTVKIDGDIPTAGYDVVLTGADVTTSINGASTSTHTNPASITSGTTEFWLQHGQEIVIQGLPVGTTYEVTVTNAAGDLTADGYVASVAGTPDTEGTANGDTFTDNTDTDGIEDDTEVKFTLTKNGTIPTGVLLAVAPAAAIVLVGGIGVTGIALKNRKKNDED